MKWLNYHHLYYFRTIAMEGSIANASKKLNIGRPALSSQLKSLEECLGTQLFERKQRRLILTEEGKVALRYAMQIFKVGEEFLQVFNEKSFGRKRHYNIGATDIIPKTMICDLIEKAKEVGEGCSISVYEESLSVLVGKLMAHEVDVLLTNSDLSTGFEVNSKKVAECKIGAYSAECFSHLKKDFPSSLNEQPIILPTKHSRFRFDIDQYYRDQGLKYDLVTECQDSAVQKILAVKGKGIILLPLELEAHLKATYGLIKLGEISELKESFWLNYPNGLIANELTKSVLDSFKIQK